MRPHIPLLALSLVRSGNCVCGDPAVASRLEPQVGEWETIVDRLPFPLVGEGRIRQLTIGGKSFQENFANRGAVEVLFDHEEATISVEVRKYMFGSEIEAFGGGEGAAGVFDRLQLWAFTGDGDPVEPDVNIAARDCTKEVWKDLCTVRAYYDGVAQPERSGMDLRVRLPAGYRGKLVVHTEDNVEIESYPRRGDVTIDGLCGSGEVDLRAGRAEVRLCAELSPSPNCPAEGIVACEAWPDGTGSEAWSTACPCGDGSQFGELLVRAPQPWAADITVDVPEALWATAVLQNLEPVKPHMCAPQAGACASIPCELDDGGNYLLAEFNHPSAAAASAGGFKIDLVSGGCDEVAFVDDSEGWKPESEGAPPAELRGFVQVCAGCL